VSGSLSEWRRWLGTGTLGVALVFAVMVGIALLIWEIAIVLDRMDIRQFLGRVAHQADQ
jgi:hypothetical protein